MANLGRMDGNASVKDFDNGLRTRVIWLRRVSGDFSNKGGGEAWNHNKENLMGKEGRDQS